MGQRRRSVGTKSLLSQVNQGGGLVLGVRNDVHLEKFPDLFARDELEPRTLVTHLARVLDHEVTFATLPQAQRTSSVRMRTLVGAACTQGRAREG